MKLSILILIIMSLISCSTTRYYKSYCRNDAPRNADVVHYDTGEIVMIVDGYNKNNIRHCQAAVFRKGKLIPLQYSNGYVYEGEWEVFNYKIYTVKEFNKLKEEWSKANLAKTKLDN